MKKTHSLDLLFITPSEGDLPSPARSHVYIKNSMVPGYRGGFNPSVITADCETFEELQYQVDRLQKELEAILKSGRGKYAAHDRQQAAARDVASQPPPER